MDFHIGIAATTLVGIGVASPLNGHLAIEAAIGRAMRTLYYADVALRNWNGLGLLMGGR
jgi:hypothetical protein